MFKNIKYNEKYERTFTAIFGLLGIVAIFVNLHLKGYSAENWLDAIKDIAGLAVVLVVFIVSVRYSLNSRKLSDYARVKLEDLRMKHKDFLMGPQYNRENYDPEQGKGMEYLFVTNNDLKSKKRAKFIPIQPLNEGVLVIYVQKGTLVHGLNFLFNNSTEEEINKEIKRIQALVKREIMTFLNNNYKSYYECFDDFKKDTAIIIDFDENKLGKRKFSKAVEECAECAVKTLIKIRDENVLQQKNIN